MPVERQDGDYVRLIGAAELCVVSGRCFVTMMIHVPSTRERLQKQDGYVVASDFADAKRRVQTWRFDALRGRIRTDLPQQSFQRSMVERLDQMMAKAGIFRAQAIGFSAPAGLGDQHGPTQARYGS